jgi:hypothetical protein
MKSAFYFTLIVLVIGVMDSWFYIFKLRKSVRTRSSTLISHLSGIIGSRRTNSANAELSSTSDQLLSASVQIAMLEDETKA